MTTRKLSELPLLAVDPDTMPELAVYINREWVRINLRDLVQQVVARELKKAP